MLRFVALLCACAFALSNPIQPDQKPEYVFKGDIAIDPYSGAYGLDRNSLVENRRWKGGRIPYVFKPGIEKYEKLIREVMDYIEEKTCVTFPKKTDADKQYIEIQDGPACMAFIGTASAMTNMTVFLNVDQCMVFGVILHELTHSIGFYHEHARQDRDEFVEIFWENIEPTMKNQFEKVDPKTTTTFNDFDYDSIMMYDDLAFSLNPYKGLKTMKPRKPGVVLKGVDKKKYTASDIYRIKKMYNCP